MTFKIAEVYTKKEYTCKKCNGKIYYAKIADESGNLITTDGQPPNGKFGKESNVLSGAVDALVKDRLHSCSAHFVTEAIEKINSQKVATKTTEPQKPLDFIILDDATRELIQYLTRKHIEIKYVVEQTINAEHPIFNNPASIGQILNLVKFDLEKVESKKENK